MNINNSMDDLRQRVLSFPDSALQDVDRRRLRKLLAVLNRLDRMAFDANAAAMRDNASERRVST